MIFSKIKIKLFILILLITASTLLPENRLIKAIKVNNPPKTDGFLTDSVWEKATVFSDFKMIYPDTDIKPTEKTEVRILYSKSSIYFGIKCFSSEPDKISIKSLKKDHFGKGTGDDLIKILLDPFQDKRNAYVFIVNPKGARTDGLAFGEHFSTNWDGIWEAKTHIDKEGWSVEIRIPFKTISFNSALTKWGINIERYIARKIETIRMEGISKDIFFYNPNQAALLGSIKGIKQGLGVTFKPYSTVTSSKDFQSGEKRSWKLDAGFDLYKNFTPNLVGVFTYNTDFAETEVDERRLNLTRFSLYYPEKRSFFLEGSEIFSFGSGIHRSFVPFFSRKIGLYNGEQVPINYGVKVYGKIGKTNIGLLNVGTKSTDLTDSRNFIVGRISQNIFEQSKVGIIFTKGDPRGDDSNSLFGTDFKYSTSKFLKNKNFAAGGWWVYNKNSEKEGKHYGYGINFDYPNDLLDLSFSYNYFGDSLNPGLGFLPRNSVQVFRTGLQYSPRPQKGIVGKIVRKFHYELYAMAYLDLNGNLESGRMFTAPINFRTENGEHIEFNVIPAKEVLAEDFALSDKIVFHSGSYQYTRYRFEFNSASYKKVTFDLCYKFGGFYSGNLRELQLGTSFKHNGNISLGVDAIIVRGTFPQGKYKTNLYRVKGDFFLNPDMGLMTFIQYDDESRKLGANIRLKWRISPGNTVYLVYNKSWERRWDPISRFFPMQDLGVFKIQLSVRP